MLSAATWSAPGLSDQGGRQRIARRTVSGLGWRAPNDGGRLERADDYRGLDLPARDWRGSQRAHLGYTRWPATAAGKVGALPGGTLPGGRNRSATRSVATQPSAAGARHRQDRQGRAQGQAGRISVCGSGDYASPGGSACRIAGGGFPRHGPTRTRAGAGHGRGWAEHPARPRPAREGTEDHRLVRADPAGTQAAWRAAHFHAGCELGGAGGRYGRRCCGGWRRRGDRADPDAQLHASVGRTGQPDQRLGGGPERPCPAEDVG